MDNQGEPFILFTLLTLKVDKLLYHIGVGNMLVAKLFLDEFLSVGEALGLAVKPEYRFVKADFRSSFVKILANTTVLAVFCAVAEQKSALYKIRDLKARRF